MCYIIYVDPFDDKQRTDRLHDGLDRNRQQHDSWPNSRRYDHTVPRIRLHICNYGKPSNADSLD